MEDIYQKILKMREIQEADAGPFFAELSSHETWLEILRWMLHSEAKDFSVQMTEVAAMALWALEANEASVALDNVLENAFSVTAGSKAEAFGPLDRPLFLSRSRKK